MPAKEVFEIRGYELRLCQTPAEALRVAASMWFDIIISDSGMPETDGYELLARLLAQDSRFAASRKLV
ncbi:MAG: response regulator [Acidobacteria bacterium]|nr:response regulator [Acidobacteriota bacterium]